MSTTELTWFKSSYSSGDGYDCVEVANRPDAIHVRDSKRKDGDQFAVAPGTWTAFLNSL